jgi:hypothetical protein
MVWNGYPIDWVINGIFPSSKLYTLLYSFHTMVFQITSDPKQAAKALFTVGDGFDELTPDPAFDYTKYKLDTDEAEKKLALLITGMTEVADKTGRFVYQRELVSLRREL